MIVAVDAITSLKTDYHNSFEELTQYQQISKDWLFGYLSYDLKNDIEELKSENFDGLDFPELFFFQPKKLFLLKGSDLEICYLTMCDDEVDVDLQDIFAFENETENTALPEIKSRVSKADYLEKVGMMKHHISKGDIYEANFCIEFYADNTTIDPVSTYLKLNAISEPPFATFFKNHNNYVLSASPERYLRKQDSLIISQPIKGTARRHENPEQDQQIKSELVESVKERAENIMIVDLVRNDLSKTADKGSVHVEELCGAYTFKQVHHLISTVTSTSQKSPVEIIRESFPMGSMTGAPKISAMQIIETLEETKRGVYSGAIGYFDPSGNFDFNVVIRSIFYNKANGYLSFSVGSAITSLSDPEKEHEECLIKSVAMRRALSD